MDAAEAAIAHADDMVTGADDGADLRYQGLDITRYLSALAGAYGIAVSMTMLVTTILFGQYLRRRFNIPSVTAYVFVAPVILLEVIFVCSNFTKILESGWLPLTAGFGEGEGFAGEFHGREDARVQAFADGGDGLFRDGNQRSITRGTLK